jgi:splicing factor 3B subunit 3
MKLYNLTLQRPGGITHVIHGNFSGPKQQEIVVSRGCVLEVLKPDSSTGKIHTLLTCNAFGLIRSLLPIRLTGSNRGMQIKSEIKFLFNSFSPLLRLYRYR